MATTSRPFLRRAFRTAVTSLSSIATSPAMAASSCGPGKRCPGIQSHTGVDYRSVFLHPEIVAPNSDLVNGARLFAFTPGDFGELGGIESCATGARGRNRFWFHVSDQVQTWFHAPRKVGSL